MTGAEPQKENPHEKNRADETLKITFKEFWAICWAQYQIMLPQLLIMVACVLAAYALIYWFFLR